MHRPSRIASPAWWGFIGLLLCSTTQAARQLDLNPEQIKAMAVQTQGVEAVSVTPIGVIPGQVLLPPSAQQIATIPFHGVIVGMHVQDGQRVRAGQPLLTLRSRDAGMAAAEATRLAANTQVADVTAERDRMLVSEGITAGRRATESHAEAQAAKAAAQAAQSALQGLRRSGTRADEFVLLASAAGVIAERGLHIADEVQANTVAFVITSGNERWVEAQLPEKLLHAVRVGDSASIALNNSDQQIVNGKIIAIGQQIDVGTRAVLLRASFTVADNESARQLLAGRTVQLIIATPSTTATFRVPATAVVRLGNQEVVFKRNAQGFAVVPVIASARIGGFTTIAGELDAKTIIAISGVSSLKAMAQVQ